MVFSEAIKSNILQKAVTEKAVLFLYKQLVRPLWKNLLFLSGFKQKNIEAGMKVVYSNEQVKDTKWIFIGTSLAVSYIAVAVVTGMIRLANTRSKGKNNFILQ